MAGIFFPEADFLNLELLITTQIILWKKKKERKKLPKFLNSLVLNQIHALSG